MCTYVDTKVGTKGDVCNKKYSWKMSLKMTKYDLYNMHGAPLCHKVGCRKHKKLTYVHRGLFCQKHTAKLDYIRNKLKQAKNKKNIHLELRWRQEEVEFRKTFDKGHCRYLVFIENQVLDTDSNLGRLEISE